MKICLFTNTFFPTIGGAEQVIHALATEFHERGHAVTVLAPGSRGKKDAFEAAYQCVRYSPPISKRFGVRQLLLPLFKIKWQEGIDILHCHNAYPPGYVARSFKQLFPSTKVVVTCHGTDIMASERLRQDPRMDRRVRAAIKAADKITAIGSSMHREILDAGAREDQVQLLPNGVFLDEFSGDEKYEHPRKYILAMGGFRKRKGFDILLQAMKLISESDQDIDLLLAGDGIERDALEALQRELQLEGRVHFLGNQTGADKIGLLRSCEFFVFPSRWEEPFGIVTLEAMAAGKTIIASNVGGIKDVVRHGENGILVEKEDPKSLADAMLNLLQNPERRVALEAQARATVKAYEWSQIADQYLALFSELLEPAHAT